MAIAPLPDLEHPLDSPWPRPSLRLVDRPLGAGADGLLVEWEPPGAGTSATVATGAPAPAFSSRARPATVRRRGVSARTRRRRLFLSLGVGVAVVLLALPVTALGGRPATPPASPSTAVVVPGSTVYVVQPGDTLWSIATAFDHGGDPRPLAEAIAKETGSAVVVPGERIRLP